MKKTIAALGASVLGLGSAAVVGAAPAAAEPMPACTDFEQQVGDFISSPSGEDFWFENCVPQYGLGKVEFTIVPDEDDPTAAFPDGFVELSEVGYPDSPVTATTTLDQEALAAYFAPIEAPEDVVPITPMSVIDETATSQTYMAMAFAPIDSLVNLTPETTPAAIIEACDFGEAEFGGWVADYAPIDATFTQTIDGAEWAYTITGDAPDSYFLVGGDEDLYLCITDGETVISGTPDSSGVFLLATVWPFLPESTSINPTELQQLIESVQSSGLQSAIGTPVPAEIGESGLYTLGVFERLAAPAPAPALAATGSDGNALLIPAIIVGGVVVLGGALVAVSVIRRRRSAEPAPTETAAPADPPADPTA